MPHSPADTVSPLRLNLLRAGYLFLVAGLGTVIWPQILSPRTIWPLDYGVIACMLGALCALSVLGLRHPLRMLPLLMFEMAWKTLWLVRVALPLWYGHQLSPRAAETMFDCATAIVFPLITPWGHVWRTYVAAPADPWRRGSSRAAGFS